MIKEIEVHHRGIVLNWPTQRIRQYQIRRQIPPNISHPINNCHKSHLLPRLRKSLDLGQKGPIPQLT
jgi:hypothetical protein